MSWSSDLRNKEKKTLQQIYLFSWTTTYYFKKVKKYYNYLLYWLYSARILGCWCAGEAVQIYENLFEKNCSGTSSAGGVPYIELIYNVHTICEPLFASNMDSESAYLIKEIFWSKKNSINRKKHVKLCKI